MILKTFNQQITYGVLTLVVGTVAVVGVKSAIAQPSLSPAIKMAQTSSLQGSWRLANMTESPFPTPMVPPNTPELTAEFSKGRISGSGGCNRFMGSYKLKGNQLSIGPLASTFMACEESIANQESRYLKALEAAERYEVTEDGLQIFYKSDQKSGVLRFTSKAVRALW